MAQLGAKKYATALFEIAKEENLIDVFSEEAIFIEETFKNEPDFLATILHPQVTIDEKISIVLNVFKGFSEQMLSFLQIVIRKNRQDELLAMLSLFLEYAEEHKGIINATVRTSAPLTKGQFDSILTTISEKTKKTVNLTEIVDESLMGGFLIKTSGFIYDNTVKKQLEDMRAMLLS